MKDDSAEDDTASIASDYSFVEFGSCNLDFLIKIAINENDDLKYHRIRLKEIVNSNDGVSFSKLKGHVKKKISGELKKLEFSYLDEEGDVCLVTSTKEFLDAISQFTGKGSLKLVATSKVRDQKKDKQTSKSDAVPTNAVPTTHAATGSSASNGKTTSDPGATKRIIRAMRGVTGNPREAEECPPDVALFHLLDDFQDHINTDFSPAMSVDFQSPDAGFDPDAAWGPLVGYYTMLDGTQRRSKFFAMDDIYLDLTEDMPMKDIVRLGVPILLLERLSARIQPGASDPPFDCAPEDVLEPVEAKFDLNNPPEFVTMKEELGVDGKPTGTIVTKSEGKLTDILKSQEHRNFYRISGVFQAENKYVAEEDRYALAFSLVALRVYSIQNEVLETLKNGGTPGPVDDPVYVD